MLKKKYERRLELMLVAAACIFLILLGRMAYLQLYKGDYYGNQADGNRLRRTKIIAPRGLFFDFKGQELVNNLPGYAVALQRQGQSYNDNVIGILAEILEMPAEQIRKRIAANQDSYEPTRLKSNVSPEVITKIEERRRELPGVLLELQPIRNYLYKELAVHALGYVGEASEYEITKGAYKGMPGGSIVGKFGLEKTFDKMIRGIDGSFDEEVDVAGNVVKQLGSHDPVPGKSLQLTIDKDLQVVLEKAVDEQLAYLRSSGIAPNARAAAIVAIDPRSGAVRAMVSRPAFDPNLFVNGISEKNWQVINNDPNYPMGNKVISGEYPPGSTFKIITGTAALELGKVTPEELIFDSGQHWLVPMGNAGGEALGWINFQQALSMSDNVYFYEMGNRLGIDNLVDFARKFGMGKKTGIELEGEASGLLPTPENKRKIFTGEDWTLGDTFNASIGQGIDLATPLQMAVMMSCIAGGGVYHQPYLVDKLLNNDGSVYEVRQHQDPYSLGVSQKTLDLIKQGLMGVAQPGGTASYFANLPRPMAAKTGTAENPHGRDHGLFVAYGPADAPELVVAAVVEQGSFGSISAGPIVYKVFEEWFREEGLIPPAVAK
ncbi:penicillin-binding protein 2 [uncultured Phascolarctobacterium sp.]|uniref:penicillin-binding protein 2 n=1 Tax=uncultured Phascolarctobacterium sp. TaxID=512296 RepID=UPI0027D9C6F7|nr:penicillin-binding protein 2 [uncultured Phascolarctobacterium sp.]